MDIPFEFGEQTGLDEPIKIRLTGRMRARIDERVSDYVGHDPNEDDDPFDVAQYRAYARQKTNIVIKTVEEAYVVYSTMGHYRLGAHWMNGMMQKAAQRVSSEVLDEMKKRGYEAVYSKGKHGSSMVGFEHNG